MTAELDELIEKLEFETPIQSFKFGHTPLQIEYFQTSSQQGNDRWEYWQHILQLKSLHSSLCDLQLSYNETLYEIEDAERFWPLWTFNKRKRCRPRLRFKLKTIQKSIDEKSREVEYHLEIIDRKYQHLKSITEDDILKEETSYWTQRLGKQLAVSHLGRILGVSEGELSAVLALPIEQQRQIFHGMRQLLSVTMPLLPHKQQQPDEGVH